MKYNQAMPNRKPTKQEISALEAQIKNDQEKPVRGNERRVRIGEGLGGAVKKMAKTPPVSNKDLAKWSKEQRDTSQD